MQFLPFFVQLLLAAICVVAYEPNPKTDITFSCKKGIHAYDLGHDDELLLRETQTFGHCVKRHEHTDPKSHNTIVDYEIKAANRIGGKNDYNCIGTNMENAVCCAIALKIDTAQPYPGTPIGKGNPEVGKSNCYAVRTDARK